MDERFVASEKSVTPGEEVAFQPSLARSFAENFHYPTIGRKMVIFGVNLSYRNSVRNFQYRI